MPRVLTPSAWHCSLSGSHDACVAWFLSVSPQLGANEENGHRSGTTYTKKLVSTSVVTEGLIMDGAERP